MGRLQILRKSQGTMLVNYYNQSACGTNPTPIVYHSRVREKWFSNWPGFIDGLSTMLQIPEYEHTYHMPMISAVLI